MSGPEERDVGGGAFGEEDEGRGEVERGDGGRERKEGGDGGREGKEGGDGAAKEMSGSTEDGNRTPDHERRTGREESTAPHVLANKRDATRYQVLVEIASRQPAVSQGEVAGAVGVTSQAVSDYVRDLVDVGYVEKHGRGRYEVTKEGVDWLITRTDALEEYLETVSSDVLGSVEVDAAIATGTVAEGDTVGLIMRDGVLHAVPGGGDASAVAVTEGGAGDAVGVTDFEGVVNYEQGAVTAVVVPGVTDGPAPEVSTVAGYADRHDLVAVAGTEAYVTATDAGLRPDIRFGTPDAVTEAAVRGLDVFLLAVADTVSRHTARLREGGVRYEVHDPIDER